MVGCRRQLPQFARPRHPSAPAYSLAAGTPIPGAMEFALPVAGVGFALGWPIEWVIQRFPLGYGTPPSIRRRWLVAGLTALLFALLTVVIGLQARLIPALILT